MWIWPFGSSMTTAPELPSLFRADSLAEQAYRVIREGIATGLFSAGERVTERGLAARLNVSATHKITEAALDRMAAIVDAQSSEQGIDIPERLRIAREFDMEIERAADNPTLRGMILSLSIIGQERRTRSVESLLAHPEVGLRRVQDHRDLLAAFRRRDPDLVEQLFRRHATGGVELLLD